MTLAAMIATARSILNDEVGEDSELLWTDAEITGYVNEAVERMIRKVPNLLKDSLTDKDADDNPLCLLSLADGTFAYALHPSILDVVRVKLSGIAQPLEKRTTNWMDERISNWDDTSVTGTPSFYITDYQTGYVAFSLTPNDTYSARLTVCRLPIDDEILEVTTQTASPVVHQSYHQDLLWWVLSRCYSKNDIEAYNENQAKKYADLFEAALGRISNEEFRRRGSVNVYPHRGNI